MGLILKDLKKSFDDKVIFDGFSSIFADTGVFAIVGDSGVGKTTLLRMIAGLDNEYEGEISGGGIQNVSYAFQEHRLFPQLTALENAVLANGELKDSLLCEEAKAKLLKLGFSENDLSLLPSELSGGMKQRVAFVRALIKESPILILDEPTKELDQNTSNIMLDIITEEAKKRLVIVVSHDDIHQSVEAANIITL